VRIILVDISFYVSLKIKVEKNENQRNVQSTGPLPWVLGFTSKEICSENPRGTHINSCEMLNCTFPQNSKCRRLINPVLLLILYKNKLNLTKVVLCSERTVPVASC
jgi:hypothetical protein